MKKIICILVFSTLVVTAFSQQNSISPEFTQQDYLKKSKHQKTAAWILAGVGLLSQAIYSTRVENHKRTDDNQSHGDGFFLATGIVAIAGSITLFVVAATNKKKSKSLSFRNEPIPQFQNNHFTYQATPTLAFKIQL